MGETLSCAHDYCLQHFKGLGEAPEAFKWHTFALTSQPDPSQIL